VAAAPAGAAAPAPAGSGEEAKAYEAAQAQRRIGNYQGAIAAFQQFVGQYPKSTLAHRAQYWIGDSYFNMRDYRNAIASQQKLLAAYGDSPSVPDALLNIASSQLEQGETAAARKTLEGLVNRYPASDAAEKAKRRLAALK
jgi:tol-pal system protein YbgF